MEKSDKSFFSINPPIKEIDLPDCLKGNSMVMLDKEIEFPDYCEFEQKGANFSFTKRSELQKFDNYSFDNYSFGVLFQCENCKKFIAISYEGQVDDETIDFSPVKYDFNFNLKTPSFPFDPIISENFPSFKKLYKQSSQVESLGINDLAGMGFRKSLEVLVTDYLKLNNLPTINDNDKEKTLKEKIDLIDLPEQSAAIITAYVGNDFAHPKERNPDLTLKDEKDALGVFVAGITQKLKVKEYEQRYNERKN